MKLSDRTLAVFTLTTITLIVAIMNNVMLNVSAMTPLKLKLTLSTIPKTKYTTTSIPLKITFKNVGEKQIRILNYFSDPKALPVFFSFGIKRDNGETIPIPGAGKISFAREHLKYITLNKNEKFDLPINLADIIPSGVKLEEGAYTISVSYHNQYGEDAFKGSIDGNSVTIKITK